MNEKSSQTIANQKGNNGKRKKQKKYKPAITSDFLVFSKESSGDDMDVWILDKTVWLMQKSMCSL